MPEKKTAISNFIIFIFKEWSKNMRFLRPVTKFSENLWGKSKIELRIKKNKKKKGKIDLPSIKIDISSIRKKVDRNQLFVMSELKSLGKFIAKQAEKIYNKTRSI